MAPRHVLLLLLLAYAVVCAADAAALRLAGVRPEKSYLRTVETAGEDALIARALASKKTIVAVGSSELANQTSPFVVNRLVPTLSGRPVLAVGRGGNQSLAIAALLASHFDALAGSKLVVFVSPSWFHGATPPQVFFEMLPPAAAARLLFADGVPRRLKTRIAEYVTRNRETTAQLGASLRCLAAVEGERAWPNPGTLLSAVVDEHLVGVLSRRRENYLAALSTVRGAFRADAAPESWKPGDFDWNDLALAAATWQTDRQEREYGIEHEYLLAFPTMRPPLATPKMAAQSDEYGDFKLLVELVKESGADALFVVNTLNALAYTDLAPLRAIHDDMRVVLLEAGAPTLELREDVYHAGSFKDPMHPGAYDWVRVARAIAGRYGPGEAAKSNEEIR